MQTEVDKAVRFICGLLRARQLSLDLVETFRIVLCEIMYGRYEGHWFPDKPCKGSAYRCVRINDNIIDPILLQAARTVGLSDAQFQKLLPPQLTIWVDPTEVAYRIGEEGSIGIAYDANAPPEEEVVSDSSSVTSSSATSDDSSSTTTSTPSQSPVPSLSSGPSSRPPSPYPSTTCRQQQGARVGGAIITPGGAGSVGQYSTALLIASS